MKLYRRLLWPYGHMRMYSAIVQQMVSSNSHPGLLYISVPQGSKAMQISVNALPFDYLSICVLKGREREDKKQDVICAPRAESCSSRGIFKHSHHPFSACTRCAVPWTKIGLVGCGRSSSHFSLPCQVSGLPSYDSTAGTHPRERWLIARSRHLIIIRLISRAWSKMLASNKAGACLLTPALIISPQHHEFFDHRPSLPGSHSVILSGCR